MKSRICSFSLAILSVFFLLSLLIFSIDSKAHEGPDNEPTPEPDRTSFIPVFRLAHPSAEFRTIKTDHFILHYPQHVSPAIPRVSDLAEKAFESLTQKMDWQPKRKIHVVIHDNFDDANGSATVFPQSQIVLRLALPSADSSLGYHDDFLEILIVHELTHILHLERHGGIAKFFRFFMGPAFSPNAFTPPWYIEGVATLQESLWNDFGRAYSPYGQMLLRNDIMANRFPRLGDLNALGRRYPGAQLRYIYSSRFLHWLQKNYGSNKINEFNEKTGRSLMLWGHNRQARRTFGKTWGPLWRAFEKSLRAEFEAERTAWIENGADTPVETLSKLPLKKAAESYLAYPKRRGFTGELTAIVHERNRPSFLARFDNQGKYLGKLSTVPSETYAWSHEDKPHLLYARQVSTEPYHFHQEIFLWDPESKKSQRIEVAEKETKKRALRLTQPDFSPVSGGRRFAVAVTQDAGTEELIFLDIKDPKKPVLRRMTQSVPGTEWDAPRFSPDGQWIVALRLVPKEGWKLVLLSLDGKTVAQWQHAPKASGLWNPTFHPRKSVIWFVSDHEGIPQIYSWNWKTGSIQSEVRSFQGVFQPEWDQQGETLWCQRMTSYGAEIIRVRSETAVINAPEKSETLSPEVMVPSIPKEHQHQGTESKLGDDLLVQETEDYGTELPLWNPAPEPRYQWHAKEGSASQKYKPIRYLFPPKTLIPSYTVTDNLFLVGISTLHHDPLYRHTWLAGIDYQVQAGFVGGFGVYTYNRYRFPLVLSGQRYLINWGEFNAGEGFFYEQRHRASVGSNVSFQKYFLMNVGLDYFFEDRDNFSEMPRGYNIKLDHVSGLRLSTSFSRLGRTIDAISTETGSLIRAQLEVSDEVLGSSATNEQEVLTGEGRFFFRLPWHRHHVLGFKVAGGYVWGDRDQIGSSFRFGGPFGEGFNAGFSSRLFPFRGLANITFQGDRALTMAAEYRLPLWRIEWGFNTAPWYFKTLHLGIFGEMGDIWARNQKDNRDFFEDFLVSTGAEFRLDSVAFYGLPLTTRLGYAKVVRNQERLGELTGGYGATSLRDFGLIYLQFGTPF